MVRDAHERRARDALGQQRLGALTFYSLLLSGVRGAKSEERLSAAARIGSGARNIAGEFIMGETAAAACSGGSGEKPTVATARKRVPCARTNTALDLERACVIEQNQTPRRTRPKGGRWAACAACVRNFGLEIDERDLAIDLVVGA